MSLFWWCRSPINQLTNHTMARRNKKTTQTVNNASPPLLASSSNFSCFSLSGFICVVAEWKPPQWQREAQNSRGCGRPAGLACGLLSCALCSVSKPSAGLWNGGCFLMHASGQSPAYTPSTISVLYSFSFSRSLSLRRSLSFFSHTAAVLRYLEKQWKHTQKLKYVWEWKYSTWSPPNLKFIPYSTPLFLVFLFYNCYYELNNSQLKHLTYLVHKVSVLNRARPTFGRFAVIQYWWHKNIYLFFPSVVNCSRQGNVYM